MTSLFVAFIVFYLYIFISSLSFNIEVNEYCVVRGSSGHLSLRHVFLAGRCITPMSPWSLHLLCFWTFFHLASDGGSSTC